MKNSVIVRYLDQEGNEKLTIGSYAYVENVKKECRQVIEMVGIEQTEEERYRMTEMSQEELYRALIRFIENNEIYVQRPN